MRSEEIIHLFSYGTLQLESVQLSSLGRVFQGARMSCLASGVPRSRSLIRTSSRRAAQTCIPSSQEAMTQPTRCRELFSRSPKPSFRAADEYEVSVYERIKVRWKSGVEAWVYVKAR
jgi:hypothetical protein